MYIPKGSDDSQRSTLISSPATMGDVEEEIDEIEDEYEDDFDVDDEDGAATAHDAPQAPRETEPTAGSVSLANCTTGGFPGSDAQNTTAAAGVQGEDETLEERIKRKQEEVPVLSVHVSVCMRACVHVR